MAENIVKLGDYIEEYSVRNKNNENIRVYSVTNTNGFCTEYFDKDVASKDQSNYKIVPRGYFAYNPSRVNVGSIDYQNEEDRVIVSPLYVVFKADERIDNDYLLNYLKSDVGRMYIKELASGSVRANLKFSILKEFPFPLVSIDEQREKMNVLRGMDRILNICAELLKKLDEAVKSRFIEMFGDPIKNNKGWETATISDIAVDVHYGTSRPAVDGGKFPYLRMNNITYDGHLDLSELKYIDIPENEIDNCRVTYGDVLFNRTNSIEKVGKTCVFNLHQDMVIAGYIIRLRIDDRLCPLVLSTYLNLDSLKRKLRGLAKGAVNQANINAQQMQSIGVYLPPRDLQEEFIKFSEAADKSKLAVDNIRGTVVTVN